MKRKLLFAGIALVLLALVRLFAVCLCMTHCTNGIRHGTVVMVSVDPDSIVMAADSREANVSFSSKRVTYADTAQKIFHIRSTFFAIAGLGEISKMSTRAFVTKIYDTTKSIEENVPELKTKLQNALQHELDSYSKKQKHYLAGHEYSVYLFIGRFEKGVPVRGFAEARVKFVNQFANPVEAFGGASAGRPGFDQAGITDHISQVGVDRANGRLQEMKKLISLEARYHLDVDSLIQYVVIKKDGVRMGYFNR